MSPKNGTHLKADTTYSPHSPAYMDSPADYAQQSGSRCCPKSDYVSEEPSFQDIMDNFSKRTKGPKCQTASDASTIHFNDRGSDTISVDSYSTTSTLTVDDNVGTGRSIDRYFCRVVSRKLGHFSAWLSEMTSCSRNRANDDDLLDALDIDNRSIDSFSTNATMDDNIGAGRTMDKYVYRPLSRWLDGVTAKWTRRGIDFDRFDMGPYPEKYGTFA